MGFVVDVARPLFSVLTWASSLKRPGELLRRMRSSFVTSHAQYAARCEVHAVHIAAL